MQLFATQLYNAIYPVGSKFEPRQTPVPGLSSALNRWDWLSWKHTETAPGVYDWTLADAYVQGNLAQGITPIACLHGCPTWREYKPGQEQAYLEAWWRYMCRVVQRYPMLKLWEIGNESDSPGFEFQGQPAMMGRVQRIAHDIIHTCITGATVVIGSIQGIGSQPHHRHLGVMLDGFGGTPDAVSLHAYPELYPSSEVSARLNQARGVVIEHVGAVPIWVTEFGLSGFAALSAEGQSKWLSGMFQQLMAADVAVAGFHAFDAPDPLFGGYGFAGPELGLKIWNQSVVYENLLKTNFEAETV